MDPLMAFFTELRNKIEKRGQTGTSPYTKIDRFSLDDINRFPKPRNARGFFMGDMTGGSGWVVEVAPGVTEKFYVDLPGDIGTAGLLFRDAPVSVPEDADVIKLGARYIAELERIASMANERFRVAV